MDLSTQRSAVGGRQVLSVRGELDMSTLPGLHDALQRFVNDFGGQTVIIDLDSVSACDDAGLGVLLGAAGRARQDDGDLVAVSSSGPLRNRLALTGFDRAVAVYGSVAQAVLGASAD